MKKMIIILLILFSVTILGNKNYKKYTFDEYKTSLGVSLGYKTFYLLNSLAEKKGFDQSKLTIKDAQILTACAMIKELSKIKKAWKKGVPAIELMEKSFMTNSIIKCMFSK